MDKKLLLIEDNPGDARLIKELLFEGASSEFEIIWVTSIKDAILNLTSNEFDVVLLDLSLSDSDGLNSFNRVFRQCADTAVIIITGRDDSDIALKAVAEGAQDYIIKGSCDGNQLYRSILHAIERQKLRIQLEQSEGRFKRMIEQNADGILILVNGGEIKFANKEAARIFNKGGQELVGASFGDPIISNSAGEIEIIGGNGSPIYVEMRVSETKWNGSQAKLVSLRDVTNRIVAEKSARLSAKVLESTSEGVIVTDLDLKIIQINTAFTNITGYSFNEVKGQTPRLLKSGKHDRSFYRLMWQKLLSKGSWSGEIWNRRKDRQIYPQDMSINAVKDELGFTTHYVGVFSDISHRKEAEKQLMFLASHDPLTKLPNRSVFDDRLKHALDRARRNTTWLAVMLLDINNFKYLNDSYGHAVGDEVLSTIGVRLSNCMRKSDTVSRLGGDEFTVLLEEIKDYKSCETVAKKLFREIENPIVIAGNFITVTASIGISMFPNDAQSRKELIKQADLAMYHAKQNRLQYKFYGFDLCGDKESG